MGRPPIGNHAMSDAERMRRHRAKQSKRMARPRRLVPPPMVRLIVGLVDNLKRNQREVLIAKLKRRYSQLFEALR